MTVFIFSLQTILVVTSSWQAVEGKLYRFQRNSIDYPWQLIGDPINVNVGKNGMAWGMGLHPELSSSSKQEGDSKAPAGIFPLTNVFGDSSHQTYAQNMPFLLIQEGLECVDDPKSKYYNQFVINSLEKDWDSSEKMWQYPQLYDLGLVVGHNISPIIPGKGSCIFMHIWRGQGLGTAGCTVMDEKDLITVVSWLDISKAPCLIQLPEIEYLEKINDWNLPKINTIREK